MPTPSDDDAIPAWDGADIATLLALDAHGDGRFRNRHGDANAHDRSYGGQVLGQAVAAAARTVPEDRAFTLLQFLFLQGTHHARVVDFAVTPLQDGKRFSSRHVRGTQAGGRIVFDAQVSFAKATPSAPEHGVPIAAEAVGEDPSSLPTPDRMPRGWSDSLEATIGYRFFTKPAVDLRFPSTPAMLPLDTTAPRVRFWIRFAARLDGPSAMHSAAFAYLSDWWVNYPAPAAHVGALQAASRRLYVASLNHAMWQHRALRADDWLHFDSTSTSAADGRGFVVARVHDRVGRHVASVTQECVMTPMVS